MDAVAFYAFGAIAVLASLLVVGQGNPMHSVMLLIVSFGALAGLYVLLDAPFTAVTQIIVYAGAIMVLFLFVVMLLNVPREEPAPATVSALLGPTGMRFGVLLSVLLGVEMSVGAGAIGRRLRSRGRRRRHRSVRWRASAAAIFTRHAFAFEATSVLILVAMVGAVRPGAEGTPGWCRSITTSCCPGVLFAIGTAGVFLRRNLITVLLSIEIMLNAVNLTFVAVGRYRGTVDGQIITFFVMTVAAAEAAVGLALVISLFRHRETLSPTHSRRSNGRAFRFAPAGLTDAVTDSAVSARRLRRSTPASGGGCRSPSRAASRARAMIASFVVSPSCRSGE